MRRPSGCNDRGETRKEDRASIILIQREAVLGCAARCTPRSFNTLEQPEYGIRTSRFDDGHAEAEPQSDAE
jgi:hypothetical protein